MIRISTATEDFTIALTNRITDGHRQAFDDEKEALKKEYEEIRHRDIKRQGKQVLGALFLIVLLGGILVWLSTLAVLPWAVTALAGGIFIGIVIHLFSVKRTYPLKTSREMKTFDAKYQNYADRKLKYKEHLWEFSQLTEHDLRSIFFCKGQKALCVYNGDTPGTVGSFEFEFDAPDAEDEDPRDGEEIGIVFYPGRIAVFGIPPLVHVAWEGDEPVMVTTDLITGDPINVFRSGKMTGGVSFGTVALDGHLITNTDDPSGHTVCNVTALERALPQA